MDGIQKVVAAGRTKSVSAFILHAVKLALDEASDWKTMPEEALEATGGLPTAEEIRWVDSILNTKPPKRHATQALTGR